MRLQVGLSRSGFIDVRAKARPQPKRFAPERLFHAINLRKRDNQEEHIRSEAAEKGPVLHRSVGCRSAISEQTSHEPHSLGIMFRHIHSC
ncbi:hypothetical protein TNCV_1769511 [Trichonephila clavipes]|nr:hypothetical protein TNCV_1769511 [Trichonephila clavipes]